MGDSSWTGADSVARLVAWRRAGQAAVCDVLTSWAHGTVVRATRYPTYFDFNLVRVEEDPGMGVNELTAFADKALHGLRHRRIDFELLTAGQPLRPGFEAEGWKVARLLWMRHELPASGGPALPVELVEYDAVAHLRLAWHEEEFADHGGVEHLAGAREVALSRGAQVLATCQRGVPVAFAQLERIGDAAEVTQVYVHPDHRGAGCGAAITRAALTAAGDVRDLWICADDEGRPKQLYARLGFRAVCKTLEYTRLP